MILAAPSETRTVDGAVQRGLDALVRRQETDGSWRGDYGGPLFLLPMYVAAAYVCRRPIDEATCAGMAAHLRSARTPEGGVGLHAEAREPLVFTTVLAYVALRLLGCRPEEEALARMRSWLLGQGGALQSAAWGKVVLALLNLYDYRGVPPLVPELYLLPYALPFHPGRLWCHSRQVFLPMSWLYGSRARISEDPLILALREEIYGRPYAGIRFEDYRTAAAPCDEISRPALPARLAGGLAALYERRHPAAWRRRGLETAFGHLRYEDETTSYIRLGPVNAVLNTVAWHFRDPGGPGEERSWETLPRYLWNGHDGIRMNGYNSSALWDTAFAVKTILATPHASGHADTLRAAYGYLRDNQVLEDPPEAGRRYRHAARGGWPFSDRAHGWPITDCTAEGLQCALALEDRIDDPIPPDHLRDSVRLILSWQNRDGGWATYERQRGGRWLERLNPSQFFRDIMVDVSHTECTSACLQGLRAASGRFPGGLPDEAGMARAIVRGDRFLRRRQRPDGSWEGAWGVCFTYGTWFGVWGLLAAGAGEDDPAIRRACAFLLDHQAADGGWGEDYRSCLERRWVPHRESQAVQTSWALLTLVRSGLAGTGAAARAARFLVDLQDESGEWPRQSMAGVFNRTTLIEYESYRRYFPVWALADYAKARDL